MDFRKCHPCKAASPRARPDRAAWSRCNRNKPSAPPHDAPESPWDKPRDLTLSLTGLVGNAVEEFLPRIAAFGHAKINPIPANRRRDISLIAKLVFGEQFETL